MNGVVEDLAPLLTTLAGSCTSSVDHVPQDLTVRTSCLPKLLSIDLRKRRAAAANGLRLSTGV